jgi:hypothetical protein
MYPNRTPLGLALEKPWASIYQIIKAAPFNVIQFLPFNYTLHELRVSKEGNGEKAVGSSINTSGEDLMDKIVYNTVKEVVPRKLEE